MGSRVEKNRAQQDTATPRSVKVSVFGPLTDVLDTPDLAVELALPASADRIDVELRRTLPVLDGRRYQIAADECIVRGDDIVGETVAELALLPPFAGG
jgi:molybdopterin converting factor small subunit